MASSAAALVKVFSKMQLEIISQFDNKLLERVEVTCRVTGFQATPSRPEVMAELAKKVAGTKDCILITEVDGGYGKGEALVRAQVYSSPEAFKAFGHKKLAGRVPRKAGGEAKPAKK